MQAPRPRSELIPRLTGEAEYLEAKRIADQLHHVHQVTGGLSRKDALMLATLCAAFEGTLEADPPTHTDNDFAEHSAALKTVAASIKRQPVGLVRIAAASPNGSGPGSDC